TATRRGGSSFAAHYGLGRLFAAEKKWPEAVREFQRAISAKPSPEAHFALACLYYELGEDETATGHLQKATELDNAYIEAFLLLGLLYKRRGLDELARDAFLKANADFENTLRTGKSVPTSPFRTWVGRYKRLVTGGDRRLAEALREDALTAFTK